MRIAIFSDTHLGYARFEEDSYVQAERALHDASQKADLILCAGDIFDTKVPKLETLKRAVDMFMRVKAPVIAIQGNHERRSRDMVGPAQLLAASTGMTLLRGDSTVFEKNGEKVQVLGVGSVPEEYAQNAVELAMKSHKKEAGAFTILMLHQSIKELVPGGEDELSMEYLEGLHFDLIVNGHIHRTVTKLDGKFIIPGSTVITQLKKEEMEAKGYFIYDTEARKAEFVPIESRGFFYEELVFSDAGEAELRERVRGTIDSIRKRDATAVIALKLDGTLKSGLSSSDIKLDDYDNVFIENRLNMESLGARLERIRSLRQQNLSAGELALKQLDEKTAGKISMFSSAELFEKLLEGPDEALAYLEGINKKDSKQ